MTPSANTLRASSDLGGFNESIGLLEFDEIRRQLAAHTRTAMGREAAQSLAPSSDLPEIDARQQETTEARRFLDQGGAPEFGPGLDFREYVQRALLGGLLRGEELYAIRSLAAASRYNRRALARREGLPRLSRLSENLPDLASLERAIDSTVSPAGELLDNASPDLRRLRQESRLAQQRLNEVMERNLRRLGRQDLIQEPIITERSGRMVLLIKAEMRSRVPGIVHDVSDSGATVFIEPMPAIDLGNRWREARSAQEREEERVLRNLSGMVEQASQNLLLTLDLTARLDLDMAKARHSADNRAAAPLVYDGEDQPRVLRVVRARHPLLSGKVVPISLELGEEQTVMLITGPNAGGKTVALKTVGLLALMAQAGLHVPADEARLPRFDGIYADIGDQQSIEQSLSTFSSHIRNLLAVIRRATSKSLVLVDELGTSTDPEEGSALAKAVLSHFRFLGVLLVATSHHRGVARYVQEQQGMINASVDLHPQTLDPTYQVTLGLPGRSYALTIADRLGLPAKIIDEARRALSPEEREAEGLLVELQEERRLVESLRGEAEGALLLAKEQQAEAEARLAAVETSKVELLEEARQELQGRISGLLDRLQRAERLLDRPAPQEELREELREERARLTEARREVASPLWEPIPVKRTPWHQLLRSGDRVFVRGIDRPVEVITPPNDQGQVEVLLGTMRSIIPIYRLERLAEVHQPAARHGVYFRRPGRHTVAAEMDLRGRRVDEALGFLEGWLNDAALAGSGQLRVIHGKGTGALRSAVREYLEGHPLVAAAAGGEGPGGEGVTVVELK